MDWRGPGFIIIIIAMSIAGWLVNNYIRAKNGYALEDEWGGKTEKADTAEYQALQSENRALIEKVDAMNERMVVLEKIVTDRGYSVAQEIDALRDRPGKTPDSGVPLNIARQEKA